MISVGYKWILQDIKLIYRNLLYFYTQNLTEWEINKIIPFTTVLKITKYRGTNLTDTGIRPVYRKLSDTDERKWRQHKWKDILCSWTKELILLKWPYYPR